MAKYSNNVVDGEGYGRPVEGALIYVYTRSGELATLLNGQANPITTDAVGFYSFDIADGTYVLDTRYAGVTYAREAVLIGSPPEFKGAAGATGPADNTYSTLASFKASDAARKTASLVGVSGVPDGRFNWTLASVGQPFIADDVNIIKADSAALSVGAWVRGADVVEASPAAAQAAINISANTNGGLTNLSKGQFGSAIIPNRRIGIRGKGMVATTFLQSSGVAIRAGGQVGSWDAPALADAGVQGSGTRQAIGIRTGPDTYATGAEYAGRLVLERFRFENVDIAVDRPFGNIGQTIRDTVFESANIHLKAVSNVGAVGGGVGDAMHAGCSWVTDSHFQGALVAVDYVDGRNVIGTCQIVRRGNIAEGNPGHVHYYTNVSHQGGFPAIKIADEYHELNNTAASVTTPDGVTIQPAWLHANNTNLTILDNAAPGRVRLVKSALLTLGCDLTMTAGISSADSSSSWINRDARCFSGKVPGLTTSIAEVQNPGALNAPTFEMPMPTSIGVSSGDVLLTSSAQAPITFVGSVTRFSATDAGGTGLPFMQNVQRITLNSGETMLPQASFSVAPNKWIVIKYVARLFSGPPVSVAINGNSGLGGTFLIDNSMMRTHVGIFRNGAMDTGSVNLYHYAGAGTSVLEIAGYCVKQFSGAQDALAFANDGVFPVETRPSWVVNLGTASRTLDVSTPIAAAGAAYSQASQQALIDAVNGARSTLATLIQDLKLGRQPQ